MTNKPTLSKALSNEQFNHFYWLKNELIDFCAKHELPTTGSKGVLSERINLFLQSGNPFEYGQFIRDYLANEKNKTLGKAFKAWKLVSSTQGPNTYDFFKKLVSHL